MATKGKKQRVFATDEEVLAIRTASNRVRAAKILVEKSGKAGRPRHMLGKKRDDKVFSKLLRYFFIPLVNALDLGDDPGDKMTFGQRLAFIFGAAHRDVVMAVATVEFKMPGRIWNAENPAEMITASPIDSRILKGTTLMVRLDERMPERVDIERCDKAEPVVFTLTKNEYEVIYKHLQEVAGCNERLMPPGTYAIK